MRYIRMPRKAVNYSRLVIYKIQHQLDESLVYVGSTTDFTKRKYNHKSSTDNEKSKKYYRKLYTMIRQNGGFESFNMIQLKEYPCDNKREAELEEDKVMFELKANMNTRRASRSKKQYAIDNAEKIKVYARLYSRQYSIDNAGVLKERSRQYYINNAEKVKKKSKEKVQCEYCKKMLVKRHLKKHQFLTKYCIKIQQNLNK